MKNNKVLYGIIGLVSLVIVDLVVFLAIKTYTPARYVNIAGLNLAIIVSWLAGICGEDKENSFLSYSKFPVIGAYSSITFILSAILILLNIKSMEFSIAVQVILLGILIIVIATNKMANNDSIEQTQQDKAKNSKIKDMAKRLDVIMKTLDDRNIYQKIEKAYDSINNAKINVTQDSTDIDNDLIKAIGIIEFSVQNKNFDVIDEQVTQINNLIIRRNQL